MLAFDIVIHFSMASLLVGDPSPATNMTLKGYGDQPLMRSYFMINSPVIISGYLMTWKFYARALRNQPCDSYAAIWRKTNGTIYRLITSHQLNYSMTIVKEEKLNYTVRVKEGDVMSLLTIKSPDLCGGNLVSIRNHVTDPLILSHPLLNSIPQYIDLEPNEVTVYEYTAVISLQAYVSAYRKLKMPPKVRRLAPSTIAVSWNSYSPEGSDSKFVLAGYIIICSTSSANKSVLRKQVQNHTTDTIITNPLVGWPLYVFVQLVRFYNGNNEVEDAYSPPSDLFCSERTVESTGSFLSIEEKDVSPHLSRSLVITLRNEISDKCTKLWRLTYEPSTFAKLNQTVSFNLSNQTSFTINPEYNYRITLTLIQLDGHETDMLPISYVPIKIPEGPTGLILKVINWNTRMLSWRPVYGEQAVNGYEVVCSYGDGLSFTEFSVYSTIKLSNLLINVTYTCQVRAVISPTGKGKYSARLKFLIAIPAAPSSLLAELILWDTVKLSWWSSNADDLTVDAYQVQCIFEGEIIFSENTSFNYARIERAAAGHYLCKVRALFPPDGYGLYGSVSFMIEEPPSAKDVSVKSYGDNTVHFTWFLAERSDLMLSHDIVGQKILCLHGKSSIEYTTSYQDGENSLFVNDFPQGIPYNCSIRVYLGDRLYGPPVYASVYHKGNPQTQEISANTKNLFYGFMAVTAILLFLSPIAAFYTRYSSRHDLPGTNRPVDMISGTTVYRIDETPEQ